MPTRRVIVVNKPDAVQTEVRVGHIGIPRKHPDYMAVNLAIRILGGEGSNRLHQVLRTERGLTYGAQANMDTLKESGDFEAETNTRSDATGEVLRLIVDEFWRLQRERGRRARAGRREGVPDRQLSADDRNAGRRSPCRCSTSLFYGLPLEELQNFRERVNAVTVDDIQRVARRYCRPDRLSVVLVGNVGGVRVAAARRRLRHVRDGRARRSRSDGGELQARGGQGASAGRVGQVGQGRMARAVGAGRQAVPELSAGAAREPAVAATRARGQRAGEGAARSGDRREGRPREAARASRPSSPSRR